MNKRTFYYIASIITGLLTTFILPMIGNQIYEEDMQKRIDEAVEERMSDAAEE